jgi:DNA-binding GntR family transcriptional regulator
MPVRVSFQAFGERVVGYVADRSASARSLAYQEIKERMLRGLVPPAAKISERALSEALGVSRTPLREALLQLESETLVERTTSGSWQVPRLDERSVRDIFAIRKQLEVLAARLSIERASDQEIAALETYLEDSEKAFEASDTVSMTWANGGFHAAVYHSAHSQWLLTAMEPVRSQTIRIRFLIAGQVVQPEYSEGHRQIFDALVARNARIAEAIVSDHVDQDLQVAIRHLDVLAGRARAVRYPGEPFGSSSDGTAARSRPPRHRHHNPLEK